MSKIDRRQFIKTTALGSAALMWGCSKDTNPTGSPVIPEPNRQNAKIALIKTSDRREGVTSLFEMMELESPAGKNVLLKPNFNTADPSPASTHNDTLSQMVLELQNRNAAGITLIERSYHNFDDVIAQKGIVELAASYNFNIVNLNNEQASLFRQDNLHWANGFLFPDIVRDAEYIVCTCCLKTHFIATHTLALKLAVGMLSTAQMNEFHSSSHIMKLIAEINTAFTPKLYIMDGVLAFIDGGPMTGTLREGNVMIAGTDRVALDAVGVAILQDLGSQNFTGTIFQQPQITRAVELGLGIDSPEKIEFITDDEESRFYAENLSSLLMVE